jgi:hypothetical protein
VVICANEEPEKQRGSKKTLRVASLVGVAVAALSLVYGTSAFGLGVSDQPSGNNDGSAARTVDERAQGFVITQSRWTEAASGEPELQVGPGQDEALVNCGSDALPSSMTALGPDGVAYCIQGFDQSDPLSISAARIVGLQLTDKGPFTDGELRYLDLQMLSGYADQESPEAAQYWAELREAWDQLSSAEQAHLDS